MNDAQRTDAGRRATCITRAGVVFLTVVAAGGCGPRANSGEEVARQLEQAIQAEVPAAARRPEVETWLDGRGIKHDYFTDTTGDRSGNRTKPMLAGLRDEDLGGMVRGMIACPNAAAGVSDSGRLSIYFFFDKQGVCVGHLVDFFQYSL